MKSVPPRGKRVGFADANCRRPIGGPSKSVIGNRKLAIGNLGDPPATREVVLTSCSDALVTQSAPLALSRQQ